MRSDFTSDIVPKLIRGQHDEINYAAYDRPDLEAILTDFLEIRGMRGYYPWMDYPQDCPKWRELMRMFATEAAIAETVVTREMRENAPMGLMKMLLG